MPGGENTADPIEGLGERPEGCLREQGKPYHCTAFCSWGVP
jgi:hypothetical protein